MLAIQYPLEEDDMVFDLRILWNKVLDYVSCRMCDPHSERSPVSLVCMNATTFLRRFTKVQLE